MKQEFEFETLGEQLEAEAEAEVRRSSRTPTPYRTNARPYGPARRPLPPRNLIMRQPVPGRRPPHRPWTPARRPTASWAGSGSWNPRPSECHEQIRWVQSSLNRIFNLDLPVDGVMSAEARRALRGFQRQRGLPVTGLVGPDTQHALLGATRPGPARQHWAVQGNGDSAAGTGNDQQDSSDADARELLSQFGLPLDEFGLQSEFENWQSGMTAAPRIIDLTAQAVKSQRKRMRDPKTVNTLVLHQMACCFKVKDPLKRFLNHFAPHFAIMADGQILQLHPTAAMTWASNGFNGNSVAVEFAGNFPNTSGKWWLDQKELKKLTPAQAKAYRQANQNQVTPQQIEAGRYLVQHLISTMGLKRIVAHRQSSNMRENDPGPDIWYHVGQWAIDNLGLTDGGPGYKIDSGNPIPNVWRSWGKATKSELEYEGGPIEAAGLGLAIFQTGQGILESGDLSVQADSANYVHQNTPVNLPFSSRSIEFEISAHHPRLFIDTQRFYFRLSFEFNRYDLRNVAITVLRDKSSSLHSSTFEIYFKASAHSLPNAPVASIAYSITNGRWDPVGLGDVSFSATPFLFVVSADGGVQAKQIDSERNWVQLQGFVPGTDRIIQPRVPIASGGSNEPSGGAAPVLRLWSPNSAAVSNLQIRLNRWLASQGRQLLEVDGAFGPVTKRAVIAFQQAERLTPLDGVVGPITWGRLVKSW